MQSNVNKTDFYPNWSYNRQSNGIVRLYYLMNNKPEHSNFSFKRMLGFLRSSFGHKLPKIKPNECEPLFERYPALRHYAAAITQMLPGPIANFCICAAKNNDWDIVDYVFYRYDISPQSFEKKTIESFSQIQFAKKQDGTYIFNCSCSNWRKVERVYFDKTLKEYAIFNYSDYKKKVVYLSPSADKQFKDSYRQTEETIEKALREKDGFCRIDFGEKTVCVKKIDNEKYSVLDFHSNATSNEECDITLRDCSVKEILNLFEDRVKVNSAIRNGIFPLITYAQRTADKYLLFELFYLAGIATNEELCYLENIIKRNRFIIRKEFYDINDVQILSVKSSIRKIKSICHRWIGYRSHYAFSLPEYAFELVIDGLTFTAIWCICDMLRLRITADGQSIYLDITSDLMLTLAQAADFKGLSA